MIEVGIRNGKYTLNGKVVKPEDFVGVDGFKFANHIVAWARGGAYGKPGSYYLDLACEYIEKEVIGNGCRRMRAPVELMDWGQPYFDLPPDGDAPYNLPNVATGLDLVNITCGTGSAFKLPPLFKKVVRMYVLLAREFEIVIEIPWLWTIKGEMSPEFCAKNGLERDPRLRFGVAVWNEHYLGNDGDGIAAYLRKLKEQGDGAGQSQVAPGPLNLLHDACNEYEAHSDKFNEAQLRAIARRHHERAGELILISESGQDPDVYHPPLRSKYGSEGYEGPCVHPPRNDSSAWKWDRTGDIIGATWPNDIKDVNESQLGWTEEQKAAWIEKVPKWLNLGSTNLNRWRKMHENFLENGIYTTFHTLRGMDAFWPKTPQTAVEEVMRSITGASIPVPPEPPDPPQPPEPPSGGGSFWDKLIEFLKRIFG